MTRLVFMDTETTGLSLADDVWEVAMIVRDREHYSEDVEVAFQVEHSLAKAARLPPAFRADHDQRFDAARALPQSEAAAVVYEWTKGSRGAHIVGAVPNFDTERLALLLRAHGYEPEWHYHLIDVETLAVGWLTAQSRYRDQAGLDLALPWDSDVLSSNCGVVPPAQGEGRHTALGDARWCRDLYDAVMAWP